MSSTSSFTLATFRASDASDGLALNASKGSELAYQDLYKQFHRVTLGTCQRYLRNYEEALDANQEIWLKVYENLPSFNIEVGHFAHWLGRVTRNHLIDKLRLKARQKEDLTVDGELPWWMVDCSPYARQNHQVVDRLTLQKLMALLPVTIRETFELYSEGLQYEDISAELSLPIGTVKSRVFRAKEILQGHLSNPVLLRKREPVVPKGKIVYAPSLPTCAPEPPSVSEEGDLSYEQLLRIANEAACEDEC